MLFSQVMCGLVGAIYPQCLSFCVLELGLCAIEFVYVLSYRQRSKAILKIVINCFARFVLARMVSAPDRCLIGQ